jgi:hypothetical protein
VNKCILLLVLITFLGYAGQTSAAETDERACALSLSKKRTLESEIEKYNCQKGTPLYITELQILGLTPHSTFMAGTRVCDFSKTISVFGLKNHFTTMCIYSGKVLTMYGSKGLLKEGDLKPPKLYDTQTRSTAKTMELPVKQR